MPLPSDTRAYHAVVFSRSTPGVLTAETAVRNSDREPAIAARGTARRRLCSIRPLLLSLYTTQMCKNAKRKYTNKLMSVMDFFLTLTSGECLITFWQA